METIARTEFCTNSGLRLAYCTPGREKVVPSVVVMLEHSGKDHKDSYYTIEIAINSLTQTYNIMCHSRDAINACMSGAVDEVCVHNCNVVSLCQLCIHDKMCYGLTMPSGTTVSVHITMDCLCQYECA